MKTILFVIIATLSVGSFADSFCENECNEDYKFAISACEEVKNICVIKFIKNPDFCFDRYFICTGEKKQILSGCVEACEEDAEFTEE